MHSHNFLIYALPCSKLTSDCIHHYDITSLLQVITDYETPPQKEFSRGLEAALQPSVAFLDCCRPLSVSMTNALRHLMWQLTQLPNNVSDLEVMLFVPKHTDKVK